MDRFFFLNYLPKRWNGYDFKFSLPVVQSRLHYILRKSTGRDLWQLNLKWVWRSACRLFCIYSPIALSIRSTSYGMLRFRTSVLATFSCLIWTCGRLIPCTTFFRVFLLTFWMTTCSPVLFQPSRSKNPTALRFLTAFQSFFSTIPSILDLSLCFPRRNQNSFNVWRTKAAFSIARRSQLM